MKSRCSSADTMTHGWVSSFACILTFVVVIGCGRAKPQTSDSKFCRGVEGILKGAFESPQSMEILSKLQRLKLDDLDPGQHANFATLVDDFAGQLSKASVAAPGDGGWTLDPIAKFSSGICKKEIVGISAVP
jgi:hypothetical protein